MISLISVFWYIPPLFVNSQPPLTREWHLYSSWCAIRRCFISLPSTRSMCQLIVVLWKHVRGKRSSQQFMWHKIMNIDIGKTCIKSPLFLFTVLWIFSIFNLPCRLYSKLWIEKVTWRVYKYHVIYLSI